MNCEQVRKEELIEKYLLGELSKPDQEAFELHYFECGRCFGELQTYRALQAELKRAGSAIQAEPLAGRPTWRWAWSAGIAVVLLAVGLGLWLRQPALRIQPSGPPAVVPTPEAELQAEPPSPPLPSLSEVAQVEPPRYVLVTLRGAVDEAALGFRKAMAHYVKEDYRAAIPGLRAASELNPKAPNISFFLGICYLLTEETGTAIIGLQRTIALGDSPYLEEAHFYLAKAFLRKGDLEAAQDQLQKTIQLQGELEGEAGRLLRQLETLKEAPP